MNNNALTISNELFDVMKARSEAWLKDEVEQGRDTPIVHVIRLLNRIPGLTTGWSCSSHPEDPPASTEGMQLEQRRMYITMAISEGHERLILDLQYVFAAIIRHIRSGQKRLSHFSVAELGNCFTNRRPYIYPCYVFECLNIQKNKQRAAVINIVEEALSNYLAYGRSMEPRRLELSLTVDNATLSMYGPLG